MYSLLTRFIPYYFFFFSPSILLSTIIQSFTFFLHFLYYSVCSFLLFCFVPSFPGSVFPSFLYSIILSFFICFFFSSFFSVLIYIFCPFFDFCPFFYHLDSFSHFSASLISTEDIILPVELFFLVIEHTSWFPVNRIEHLKFYMKNILEVVTICIVPPRVGKESMHNFRIFARMFENVMRFRFSRKSNISRKFLK